MKIFEQLYYGNITEVTRCKKRDEKIVQENIKNYDIIKSKLNDADIELFNNFVDSIYDEYDDEIKDKYIQGLKTGILIGIETCIIEFND